RDKIPPFHEPPCFRHARARPACAAEAASARRRHGHPCLLAGRLQDVDGRDKPGHDEFCGFVLRRRRQQPRRPAARPCPAKSLKRTATSSHIVFAMTDFANAFLLVYAGLFPILYPIGSAPIFLGLTSACTE